MTEQDAADTLAELAREFLVHGMPEPARALIEALAALDAGHAALPQLAVDEAILSHQPPVVTLDSHAPATRRDALATALVLAGLGRADDTTHTISGLPNAGLAPPRLRPRDVP